MRRFIRFRPLAWRILRLGTAMQVCTGAAWGAAGSHINLKGYSETEVPLSKSCSMALALFSRSFFLKLCLYGSGAGIFSGFVYQKNKGVACDYPFRPFTSSETVSFLRPLARRAAIMARPPLVAILSRKPCLFFLFLFEGWYVLFMVSAVRYYFKRDTKVCLYLE